MLILFSQQSLRPVLQDRYVARRQPVTPGIQVDFSCNGVRGVRLERAAHGKLSDLDMADERATYAHQGQKVTYRIQVGSIGFISLPTLTILLVARIPRRVQAGQKRTRSRRARDESDDCRADRGGHGYIHRGE